MKKAISITIALILLLSCSVTAFAFSDTDATAYEAAVNAMVKKQYISGYPDGTYRPEKTLSRAEACSIIVKFVGASDADLKAAKDAKFSDMGNYRWAQATVNYAVANGILTGYTDGTFRPAKEVSYAELAVMVVNAMGQKNLVSGTWDEGYMQVAAAQGYLKDTVKLNSSKDKAAAATRGNTAIIVNNAENAKHKKDDESDKTTTMLKDFSGHAYGAINGFSDVLNDDGDQVTEIEFVFGNGTQYLQTKKSFHPDTDIKFDGTLYCLRLSNGLVTKIGTKESTDLKVKKFEELTNGYQAVTKKENNEVLYVATDDKDQLIELNTTYSIYVATVDGKDATIDNMDRIDGYRAGSYRDIHKDDLIRAYDVTKDDDCADVIFVVQE